MLITTFSQAKQLAWDKGNGLLPAIVQHAFDGRVLMQAWMNRDALKQSLASRRVTFWSRSRQALWTKGESSGNFLELDAIHSDCDHDSLLVLARPEGPTCHLGTDSCFDGDGRVAPRLAFLSWLEHVLMLRDEGRPQGSYTTELFEAGVVRIAQKVGEEGVETALAAVAGSEEEVCEETADLVYHLMVLLRSRELPFERIIATLSKRHR